MHYSGGYSRTAAPRSCGTGGGVPAARQAVVAANQRASRPRSGRVDRSGRQRIISGRSYAAMLASPVVGLSVLERTRGSLHLATSACLVRAWLASVAGPPQAARSVRGLL